MSWTWIVGVAVFAAVLSWLGWLGSREPKGKARKTGSHEEEFRIDPEAVPEFKSTWRDMR